MLSLVQVIARQTAAGEPEDFIGRFTERIQALAANQDLLAKRAVSGEVELDYAPSGLERSLTCPAANALERQ
jgi:two-component sensor histidine kinase